MLNHIMLGSNDIEKSKKFYDTVLATLGVREPMKNVAASGHVRYFYMHDGDVFALTQPINDEPAECANGMTIGFKCDSPEQVTEFHDVAVANGATSIEGPPGLREASMGSMYLCYFRDPDGHKICGLHRAS
ncbi:VOC family protein [Erythrobacter sp. LQ02-29]|uniref:VOC family protein n=1 Tax=Erythrobacter sp. LQ02-29 TaxID=2920384 RepID=UPI001F4D56A8|nr:VOC family protein [Erythrobacter sp. LQ02-29]